MKNKEIIQEPCLAYAVEVKSVQNYLAASVNLDGVRPEVTKQSLAADIAGEEDHRREFPGFLKEYEKR